MAYQSWDQAVLMPCEGRLHCCGDCCRRPVRCSDGCTAGAAEDSKFQEGRIIQCFMYLRVGSAQDNHYAHPLDLLVYLDMNSGRVLDTWMYPDPPAIPQMKANYIAPLVQKERGFRTGTAMPFCQSEIQ